MGATQTSHSASIDAEQFAARASDAPSPGLAPPPGNPRFPLFDSLRALAVLGILAFHSSEFSAQIGLGAGGRFAEVAGGEAVILFFVVSGFLLYRPYVRARAAARSLPPTGRYFRRRALRILPAYWVALTVLAIYPGVRSIFSADWWRYYGYLQLYTDRTHFGGIPVAWTLCVEVSFYLALPLWALAVRRLGVGARGARLLRVELIPLVLVALGGAGIQLLVARNRVSGIVGSSLLGQCTWLCIGMGLAVVSVVAAEDAGLAERVRVVSERPGWCWAGALAALAGLIVLVPSGGLFGLIAIAQTRQSVPATVAKLALEAILVTLLVLPAVFNGRRPGLPRRILALRPLVALGVISYSFYLYHFIVVQMLAVDRASSVLRSPGFNLLGHVHFARTLTLFLASLVVTGIIATISYRFVELPFLRLKEGPRGGGKDATGSRKHRLSMLRQR